MVRNRKANDPTLVKVAEKHQKSTAQVLIRYCLQKNWVPLPKSDTPSRIEENADIYDFNLADEEMNALDGLDEGDRGAIGMNDPLQIDLKLSSDLVMSLIFITVMAVKN